MEPNKRKRSVQYKKRMAVVGVKHFSFSAWGEKQLRICTYLLREGSCFFLCCIFRFCGLGSLPLMFLILLFSFFFSWLPSVRFSPSAFQTFLAQLTRNLQVPQFWPLSGGRTRHPFSLCCEQDIRLSSLQAQARHFYCCENKRVILLDVFV